MQRFKDPELKKKTTSVINFGSTSHSNDQSIFDPKGDGDGLAVNPVWKYFKYISQRKAKESKLYELFNDAPWL